MNFVFDKKTLRVVSIFDDNPSMDSEKNILAKMFPDKYKNLSLWSINKSFNCNLLHLKVMLDEDGNPDILLYRGKEIYKCSKEEKEKIQKKEKRGGLKSLKVHPST